MDIFPQMLEKTYQFQSEFSKMIKELQVEANKYNNCYNKANQNIMDYYKRLLLQSQPQQKINMQQEQLECNNSLESLKKQYKELSEKLNIFNENVLQYQMQKFEFDNYYQQTQLSFEGERKFKQYQISPQLGAFPIQLDIVKQLSSQLNQIIIQQNLQFNKNEQLNKYISEQTICIKDQIEYREEQQRLLNQQIEENQRQQQKINEEKEELQQVTNLVSTDQHENYDNLSEPDDLSEQEELTQKCQECGSIIELNKFLTKCLHYYHEECILQKIKANYQETSIYCSCNTLINSRMIKDVLEKSKQDKNIVTFEIFQKYQIKQLLKKSNKKYTECHCGFLFVTETEEQIDNCLECEQTQ